MVICDVLTLVVVLVLNYDYATAVQCFSCEGSGLNEIAANINCLEKGYLENCDDFYEYYTKIEDKKVLTDEYYYDEEDEYYYDDDNTVDDDYNDDYYDDAKRPKRDVGKEPPKLSQLFGLTRNDTVAGQTFYDQQHNLIRLDDESKAIDANDVTATKAPINKNSSKALKPRAVAQKQANLPKDPEHYCYSMTHKLDWERYKVEKGCRKIAYCKNDADTKPEWTRPWNFCCDKSRCNAKQVKDKPQRIYGMNCRRTDDCIQGHVTRSVCPNLYKSCPKIPRTLIRMECIAKGADPNDYKERYRNPFQEKKCLCTSGNFPRGPVCTNAAMTYNTVYIIHTCILTFLLAFSSFV